MGNIGIRDLYTVGNIFNQPAQATAQDNACQRAGGGKALYILFSSRYLL
jgi:hypothetical protein